MIAARGNRVPTSWPGHPQPHVMGHVLHYNTLTCASTGKQTHTQNSPSPWAPPYLACLCVADNECLLCCPTAACGAHGHIGHRLHRCQALDPPPPTHTHTPLPTLSSSLLTPTPFQHVWVWQDTVEGHLWALKKPWNVAPWQITSSIFFLSSTKGVSGWWGFLIFCSLIQYWATFCM